jgi:hypothetical protein
VLVAVERDRGSRHLRAERPELTNGQFFSISGQTENSRGRKRSLGDSAERSISVSVYSPLVC